MYGNGSLLESSKSNNLFIKSDVYIWMLKEEPFTFSSHFRSDSVLKVILEFKCVQPARAIHTNVSDSFAR
jgi:hypothetical protein